MNHLTRLCSIWVVAAMLPAIASAQIPLIVQLPTSDFVWNWGQTSRFEDRERPHFTIRGREQQFDCLLTGSFRPGSRMRDYFPMRDFQRALETTLYFIQDATEAMNVYYQTRDLDWAQLDCRIPEPVEPDEEELQERENRALERARREQERRRARDE